MKYSEWNKLSRKMAIEVFVSDAADAMIPEKQSRANALRLAAESDTENGYQNDSVQRWMLLERSMGDALIALETLGYDVMHIKDKSENKPT